jgi:hypothetical protein
MTHMSDRRFPPPWTIERLPGGFKVIDANGQSLAISMPATASGQMQKGSLGV